MSTGALVFAGIFVLAALSAVWGVLHRRGLERRLRAAGFEPCDADAPALERAWHGFGGAGEVRVSRCLRRAAGWGLLHRFEVNERPKEGPHDEPVPGARFPAYLLDVRDFDALTRGPVTLYLLPGGNALARALIEKTIALSPPGAALELTRHPGTESILCAYGERPGKLDECMSVAVQQRLARAAAAGFMRVQLAAGKAGFAVLPAHRDVDAELACLAEWC
jgi:hypothetical protein